MTEQEAKQLVKQTLEQYNRIAADFDSTRSQSEDFTGLTQYVKEGNLVLDLGCGNGRLVDALRGTGVNMIGVDGSSELIARCKEKYAADVEKGWLGFTVSDVLELPFDSAQFDVIFLLAVMHHIPSEALRVQFLKDLIGMTKKGGLCVGTTWNLRGTEFRERYALDEQLKTPRAGFDVGDVEIPWKASGEVAMRYCHAFTIEELRALFEKAGWKILDLYPVTRDFVATDAESAHNLFWVLQA